MTDAERPPRPTPLELEKEEIPEELQERDRWVCWEYEWRGDEWTKVPKNPNSGTNASSDDADTWGSFADAIEYHEFEGTTTDGIGFMLHDAGDVVGVDLDDCRDPDTAEIEPWAAEVIEQSDTYAEASPSGTGGHLLGIGSLPEGGNRGDIEDAEGHIEMYETGRYLTVTGHKLDASPAEINNVDDDIKRVHEECIADDGGSSDESTAAARTNDSTDSPPDAELSDDELIEKAKNAENGDFFTDLWEGRWKKHKHRWGTGSSQGQSEADLALCGHLAFWTGGDTSQMDRLFRKSGLMRDKWDEDRGSQTYGDRTIEKALEGQTEFYDPSQGSDNDRGTTGDLDPAADELPTPHAFDVIDGGYQRFHPPRDGDEDGWHEQITNFQLEVLSRLTHDDGTREFHLRIHPAHGDSYEVAVEPLVFNELRKFRREVLEGWSVTFDGGQNDLNDLKQFAARQAAPDRRGTDQIGLHGDEFVTPEGSLTADGWSDEPAVIYTNDSSQLNPLWQLTPEDDPEDVDEDSVAEILKLLPQTRSTERFLPVLGWFYAAPLRPLIQQWEGEFNLLNVLGDTGAGKTATLEVLWQLFGMDGELLTAETTPFTMLTALSSTNGLPVAFDEYKPADMSERRKDKLHRYLRTSTKGGIESKGNADRTTDNYQLNAPVCLSGEQPIQGPAEERRSIMTTFTRDGVVGDTPQSRAFARLNGGKAGEEYHEGLPLEDHAMAFYTWLLDRIEDGSLREMWREARDRVGELLDRRDLDGDTLDDMTLQGFQTIWFGCQLYQLFAHEFGVDPDATAVTADAIEDAIEYVAGEGGGADHVSHLDRFVGLLSRASAAGYVELGQHYTVVDSTTNGTEELRIRLSTAFDQVRRYARDHDVRGEDLLDSVGDYRARIRDNAENPGGYVTETSQYTRLNDHTQARCVGIDVDRVEEAVDGFDLGMFVVDSGDDSDQEDDAEDEPASLSDLDLGSMADGEELPPVRATVAGVWEGQFGNIVGELKGDGDSVDVHFAGCDLLLEKPVSEGGTYEFTGLRARTNGGVVKVEHRPTTDIDALELPESADDGGGADATAKATDGGNSTANGDEDGGSDDAEGGVNVDSIDTSSIKGRVLEHLRVATEKGDTVTAPSVAGQIDEEPGSVHSALNTIATERSVLEKGGSGTFEVL